jgi:hypothetical protein
MGNYTFKVTDKEHGEGCIVIKFDNIPHLAVGAGDNLHETEIEHLEKAIQALYDPSYTTVKFIDKD